MARIIDIHAPVKAKIHMVGKNGYAAKHITGFV
jgi:hypothetical protein